MKRCPTCDKTFADGMKFCQTDGTLLIEDTPDIDPYKTIVGNQSDKASAIPPPPIDPFKTMVGSPPIKKQEEDLLQLPEEPDPLKTLVISQDEINMASKSSEAENIPKLDLPLVPIIEPKVATPSDFSPAPPKFDEPASNQQDLSNLSSPASNFPKPSEPIQKSAKNIDTSAGNESPFDSKPSSNDFSTQSPYGSQENKPIPSPFDGSMIGYQPPSAPPPFNAPKPPPVKEPEPVFGSGQQESANQSPFQPPTPFGQPEPFNQPMQQSEWAPPPAPMAEWQNQDLGANTPFQPPTTGQDQTLAIVSLVCGVLSVLCCGLITGIPAIITGYMAKNNVDSNPNQYTGRGMALAGMILGGISIVLTVVIIILQILFGVLGSM